MSGLGRRIRRRVARDKQIEYQEVKKWHGNHQREWMNI